MNKNVFLLFVSYGILCILACNNKDINNSMSSNNETLTSEMHKNSEFIEAPIAKVIPTKLEKHGDVRIDNYYWMKLADEQKDSKNPDQQTQDVVNYLNTENAYRESVMKHTKLFQDSLYNEIIGRIKQTDMSVPYRYNGYYYITKYEGGKEYAIRTRKKGNMEAKEEILIDENERAKGQKYYSASGFNISPDNKIMAFGEDLVSRRQYTLRFKNLETGVMLKDEIPNTNGSVVWANDNKTFFYGIKDETLRSYKILKHTLGTSSKKDVEIYHEKDETFSVYVSKTKSEKYIVISSFATLSQEYRFIDADAPNEEFKMFQPREHKLEYSINHFNDKWYVRTNKDEAKNFKIMTTPVNKTTKENWVDFIAHRSDVLVEGMDIFKDYFVLSERIKGITEVRIMPWKDNDHYVKFNEEAHTVNLASNPEFDTKDLRLVYTSMVTPSTTYDYDMQNQKLTLLKQQEVIGNFKAFDYQSERLFIAAKDGTQVPISLVYKRGFKKDGNSPLLLYAYGSYGYSMDPYFSSVHLSLLDRGFCYAIAHVRGGEEMGRHWYDDGKFFKKKNTFTDFIDCADYLVKNKYTNPDKLFAQGGSAGGLLMGAISNMRPDLFKGVISQVPFVDIVTTMLDETIPLTTGEYDEWGNPNQKEYYDYMKSYSPYDNIEKKNYPAMLVTTGYWDSQVQYWEPAKYVAKLRVMKTDKNPLLLYCNMETGHGGASGRFKRYKEVAMELAFMFDLIGIKN